MWRIAPDTGWEHRLRRASGITLVATVLMASLAVMVSLVLVRQAVLMTRSDAVRTDYARAQNAALMVQSEFERQLSVNPTFFYQHTFGYERPRKCLTPALASPSTPAPNSEFPWALPPSDPASSTTWPAVCGRTWSYPAPGQAVQGWSAAAHPARAEVVAPSGNSDTVTLRVLSVVGTAETGLTSTYRRSTVGSWTVWSSEDLNLGDVLATPAGVANTFGPASAFAGKVMRLPVGSTVALPRDRLVALGGFVGTGADSGSTLYTGDTSQANVPGFAAVAPASPLREQTASALRSSLPLLESAACPPGEPDTNVDPGSGATYTSKLCLRAGQKVLTASGLTSADAVAVPANVTAWMILPAGEHVRVYYATASPRFQRTCVLSCNPRAASAADVAAGRSPGGPLPEDGPSLWIPLADASGSNLFNVPLSGVIGTDADTFVSHCRGFSSSASCQPDSVTGTAGVTTSQSLTVVAGTATDPKDLYVAGPISTADTVMVGLVATGVVKVPHFASPAGATVTVHASAVGFGQAPGSGYSVVGVPNASERTDVTGTGTPATVGEAMNVAWTGSLAGMSLGRVDGVALFSLSGDVRLVRASPPVFPGFANAPIRQTSQRMTSADACGSAMNGQLSGTCKSLW